MNWRKVCFLAFAICLAVVLNGQDLTLPPSTCALRHSMVKELLEVQELNRLDFRGCISFRSNPLPEFIRNPKPHVACGLELEHIHDSSSKLQFYIYDNKDATQYSDEAWNALIVEILEGYPEQRYSTRFEKRFEADRDVGTPVLNHVPMMGVVSITLKEGPETYWNYLCVVPVGSTDKVLLVCLRTSDKHRAYMLKAYQSFLKSMFLFEG